METTYPSSVAKSRWKPHIQAVYYDQLHFLKSDHYHEYAHFIKDRNKLPVHSKETPLTTNKHPPPLNKFGRTKPPLTTKVASSPTTQNPFEIVTPYFP